MLGLNTTKARQQEVINAIIDVVRKLLANQPLLSPYTPGYPGMPGYSGMPGFPNGMPLVVNIPPQQAPIITITNMGTPYQSSPYSNFLNSK